VTTGVEFYSSLRSRRAIEGADICVLMVDATLGVENQDLKIATLAWESGRGLILVVNKWDLKEKENNTAAKFQKDLIEKVPYFAWVPDGVHLGAHRASASRACSTRCSRSTPSGTSASRRRRSTTRSRRSYSARSRRRPRGTTRSASTTRRRSRRAAGDRGVQHHPDAVAEHYIRYLPQRLPRRVRVRRQPAAHPDAAEERAGHRPPRVRGEKRARPRWQDEEARESVDARD
jgi:GTP-binding protein